jgi:hypothetical protein
MASAYSWRSMKVDRTATNALVRTMDIGGYVPGPFVVPVDGVGTGPYRIELYGGPSGTKVGPGSSVSTATCALIG